MQWLVFKSWVTWNRECDSENANGVLSLSLCLDPATTWKSNRVEGRICAKNCQRRGCSLDAPFLFAKLHLPNTLFNNWKHFIHEFQEFWNGNIFLGQKITFWDENIFQIQKSSHRMYFLGQHICLEGWFLLTKATPTEAWLQLVTVGCSKTNWYTL